MHHILIDKNLQQKRKHIISKDGTLKNDFGLPIKLRMRFQSFKRLLGRGSHKVTEGPAQSVDGKAEENNIFFWLKENAHYDNERSTKRYKLTGLYIQRLINLPVGYCLVDAPTRRQSASIENIPTIDD